MNFFFVFVLILGIFDGMLRYPFKDSDSFSMMLAKNLFFFLSLRFRCNRNLEKRRTWINKRQLSLFDVWEQMKRVFLFYEMFKWAIVVLALTLFLVVLSTLSVLLLISENDTYKKKKKVEIMLLLVWVEKNKIKLWCVFFVVNW